MKEFRNAVLSRFNITAITPEEELQLKENMKIAIQRKEQIKTINNQQEVNGTVGGHRVKLQNQVKSELVSQVPTMVTQKSPLAGSRHQNLMSPLGSTISSSSKTTMSIKNEDHLNLKRPLHNQNKPNSLNNINSPTSSTASSQIHNQIHPKKRHRTNFSNQMQANNFNNPNNHNITSLSLPNSLKTHLNRLNLHSKYPHVFQGNLVLKRENSGLDFYYISGNKNLIHQILFNANDRNLPIMQRMKLDHQHMNTLLSKLNANAMKQNADPNFCLLLGVNSLDIAIAKSTNQSLQNLIPAEKIDSLSVEEKQTLFNTSNEKLKTQFIDYLKNKDAAGVVSVNNSQIHIFPKQVNAVEMTLNFHCSDLFSLCEKNAIDYVMVVLNANHGV